MPLRLVLGLTFTWAGLGKLNATFPVKGEDAARLANMGLIAAVPASAPAPSAAPAAPLPSNAPLQQGEPAPKGGAGAGGGADAGTGALLLAQVGGAAPTHAASNAPGYTAADFPQEQAVKRLWGIALKLSLAGEPPASKSGAPLQATWPSFLAVSPWAKTQAQAVLVIELLGGTFVLLGFLTRVSAAGLAAVMLGAVWLDQLTPAIQAGTAVWGIFPAYGAYDVRAWMPLAWQGALLGAALSLTMSGPGRLSVDLAMRARQMTAPQPARTSTSGRPV